MTATSTNPDPIPEGFGSLLRSHRFREGLTQEQLANRSGLSPRAIRKIETGQSLPRASTIGLLAEAFDLSGDERCAFTSAAMPPTPSADEGTDHVPSQLPAATPIFSGRDAELESLVELAQPGNVVIVEGMAGIGKSSLAVHAARRLTPQFPDGQLFLDLCGFSGARAPVSPLDALDRLLRALGVPGDRIPSHQEDRAAAFRSALSGRRVLLLLDNVADEHQLRQLLPGDSASAVLATSRRRLTGIMDATHLRLEPWEPDSAIRLLTEAVGGQRSARFDRASLAEIVDLCGGVPLAVRIVAAKFVSRPQWTPADLLQRMRCPSQLFATLTTGQQSVAAAFDATYHGLPNVQQRLFRLLGTLPCEHFDTYTAAALLEVSPFEAEEHLEQLVDAHLLETSQPGRYHCHDLLSEYAAHTAARNDSDADRAAAFGRVLDMFLSAATTATRQLAPHHLKRRPAPMPIAPVAAPEISDHREAVAWFETELGDLLAMVYEASSRDLRRKALDLGTVVRPFLIYHSHVDDLLRLSQHCTAIARNYDDPMAEAFWIEAEGRALHLTGRTDEEASRHHRALRLYEAAEHLSGQAAVLNALGTHHDRRCEYEHAVTCLERAIPLAQRAGAEDIEGIARNNYANVCRNLGRFDKAREHLYAALAIFERTAYDRELARTRFNLGNVLRNEGDAEAALRLHLLAAEYTDRHDEPDGSAFTRMSIAHDYLELGRITEARKYCALAMEASDRARRSDIDGEVLLVKGRIHLAANELSLGEEAFAQARARSDYSHIQALAIKGTADVLAARGDTAAAELHYADALELFDAIGVPEAEALRRRLGRVEAST